MFVKASSILLIAGLIGCAGTDVKVAGELPKVVAISEDVSWADEFFPRGSRYQLFFSSESERIVFLNPNLLAPIGVVVDENLCFTSGQVRSRMFSRWLWEPEAVGQSFVPSKFCFEISK